VRSVVDLLVINVCGAKCKKLSEGMSESCGSGSGGGIQKCVSIKILKQEWPGHTFRGGTKTVFHPR
jgi:hypothetical protein